MPKATFDNYIDEKLTTQKTIARDSFTVAHLYQSYIEWLLNKARTATFMDAGQYTNFSVTDLIFQIQIINAYVREQLKASNTNDEDIAIIEVEDSIGHIFNTDQANKINKIINVHFENTDLAACNAVETASKSYYQNNYIKPAKALVLGLLILSLCTFVAFLTIHHLPSFAFALAISIPVFSCLVTLTCFAMYKNIDSTGTEISFGKNDNLLKNNARYNQSKFDAIATTSDPLNKISQVETTATALTTLINKDDTTGAVKKAILNTVQAATETRFMFMYQKGGEKTISSNNGFGFTQNVDLPTLHKRISNQH